MLAAEKIKRLNRLYAVSSGINEAIIRVPGEQQLYLEACRIAVERGGFAMAWVGRNDPVHGQLVPVARWGKDDGYVDAVRITTDTTSREGAGPGGTAFRTGEAAVCNDIESDSRFFAFRREALERGFRSCAAVPLKQQGRPVAVFFVYAAEPLYFDEHELALLSSLADNFSFAIEAREREAQRSQMEAALRASEARLRAVIENEPECVKLLTPAGNLLDINPAGLAMIQAPSLESVLGRHVADFIHPDDRAAYIDLHQRVMGGATGQMQVRAIGLQGRMLWMDTHAAPLRGEDGAIDSALYVTRDVTQQRATIEHLQQQQALLAMASRLGRIGAWAVDLPSFMVAWSDELSDLYEMPPGFSPTMDMALDFYAPDSREAVEKSFRECARHGTPFDLEVDILTRTGRRLSVRSMGEAVRDSSGKITRVQGAFQDITGHREQQHEILTLNAELEQRVRQRTAQLETANSELQAFSYSVAHDLRAPLMAIGGFSQALEGVLSPAPDARASHYLGRMREGVQRTSEMIDALLSLAQVTRTELRWEIVDLSALAHRAFEHCSQHGPPREVTLSVQPGMVAQGDARLLQLVMDNLVGNAWKFTGTTDSAVIDVGTQTGPEGETIYEVRDNGVGFDMAYASNLFGAFQRLHRQSEFPGSGIGLANVRRIISRHSGRIWAHSRPGEGAAFYFTLGDEPA
jgi:PAS domain S-box-containing protein